MTHDAFLQAIIDHPEDDTPRLAYAGWLEEHGHSRRAEFVRVQCAAARMAAGDPRRAGWEARSRALLARHGEAWVGPLHLGPQGEVVFRRGFVEEVETDARTLFAHAGRLFRLAPLRHLTVQEDDIGGADARTLASWPQLSRLESLRLPETGLGDAGAQALAASPHLAGLKVLDLGTNGVSGAGAVALAASPHLSRLGELYLDYNRIGVAGAEALARSPSLAGLTLLDLHEDFDGVERGEDAAVAALQARFGHRLRL